MQALEALREYDRRFGKGALGEERQAIAAIAACQAHPGPRALSQAQDFMRASPTSPLRDRVRAACITPEGATTPSPPPAASTYTLTSAQVDDLFTRLANTDLASLPHPTTTGAECYPSLTYLFCSTCGSSSLSYNVAAQLVPEMEQVWLWFDQLLGASASTNPRNYCRF